MAELAPLDRSKRPLVAGPDTPEPPFPIRVEAQVIRGFGRGSRELGIPTANIRPEDIPGIFEHQASGIYYGYAQVNGDKPTPMICSRVNMCVINKLRGQLRMESFLQQQDAGSRMCVWRE